MATQMARGKGSFSGNLVSALVPARGLRLRYRPSHQTYLLSRSEPIQYRSRRTLEPAGCSPHSRTVPLTGGTRTRPHKVSPAKFSASVTWMDPAFYVGMDVPLRLLGVEGGAGCPVTVGSLSAGPALRSVEKVVTSRTCSRPLP
jgi:hypothetical protein